MKLPDVAQVYSVYTDERWEALCESIRTNTPAAATNEAAAKAVPAQAAVVREIRLPARVSSTTPASGTNRQIQERVCTVSS